jgi:iron-sulfur cluster repair protein YtfE (RIC family)
MSVRADIEECRATADALGVVAPSEAAARVRAVYKTLTGQVEPHEQAEQAELYPALNRLLGGTDPTAVMSRAHAEIADQIRRLGQLLEDIGPAEPDQADIADLRGLLYGLHAMLRLHTAQEDESYRSLAEEAGSPGS